MLDVRNGVEALESWHGEGEYLLTRFPSNFDGWIDSRIYCENPVALENAIREYRSNYHFQPYVLKVVGFEW